MLNNIPCGNCILLPQQWFKNTILQNQNDRTGYFDMKHPESEYFRI